MKINKLYNIFYEKLPIDEASLMPVYEETKLVTFLNPYYMVKLNEEDYFLYKQFDYIGSDGIGPIVLNRLFGKPKSTRFSFDMSSIAGNVLQDIRDNKKKVYILGAKEGEIERSITTIENNFDGIEIAGYHHGYFKGYENDIIKEIIDSNANVAIIGMGAPIQDKMAIKLKEYGFVGTVYTCGGFIHQTTSSIMTYPKWVNKLQLRAIYRILTQKGMLKRLIETYPKFLITYPVFLIFGLKR